MLNTYTVLAKQPTVCLTNDIWYFRHRVVFAMSCRSERPDITRN